MGRIKLKRIDNGERLLYGATGRRHVARDPSREKRASLRDVLFGDMVNLAHETAVHRRRAMADFVEEARKDPLVAAVVEHWTDKEDTSGKPGTFNEDNPEDG